MNDEINDVPREPTLDELQNPIGFYHGDELKKAVYRTKIVREPLIEHLLYKKSAHMIYAPDGIGKSIVGLQMCAQSTVDNAKVFGEFNVPIGLRVLYIQMERHEDETFERLLAMSKRTPINWSNFVVTTKLQGLSIQDKADYNNAIEIIDNIITFSMGGVDLIHVDPIYALIGNDLVSNKDIAPLRLFSSYLQKRYCCSVQFVHHANRGSRDEDGNRKGMDMFGSRFLSAHFTGIYKMVSKDGDSGVTLSAEKSSQRNIEKHIDLNFDSDTQLCWYDVGGSGVPKMDRLNHYLRACKENKKPFTIDDLKAISLLSTSYIRQLISVTRESEFKIVSKGLKNKNIYEYVGP